MSGRVEGELAGNFLGSGDIFSAFYSVFETFSHNLLFIYHFFGISGGGVDVFPIITHIPLRYVCFGPSFFFPLRDFRNSVISFRYAVWNPMGILS